LGIDFEVTIIFIFKRLSSLTFVIYKNNIEYFNKRNERKILIKLASWNVNGIRACYKKGFTDWLDTELPDIACLQEIKACPDQFPIELLDRKDLYIYIKSAEKKGYSGVSIITKIKPVKVWEGLDIEKFDSEGRTLIAEFEDFVLFNCYFPNGQRDHGRVPYKLEFSDAVMNRAFELKKETGKEIIICGDYNTAHHEIDLANPKSNKKSTGFLPIEREWMDKFMESGFVDAFREFTPNENGHYSWWTYRSNCREKNVGWRLDYFFTTPNLKKKLINCYHQKDILGSDHCPVILELE
jgi:exodeoxyribonuclease-3